MANKLEPEQVDRKTRLFAALCYLSILIIIPACSARRKDPFIRFHLNQGLVLVALATVCSAIGLAPYCGETALMLTLMVDALSMVGLVQTLRGLRWPLPIISAITQSFHPF